MRLAAKLISLLIMGVVVLTVIDACLSARRTIRLFSEDMARDADLVSRVMKDLIAHEWRVNGPEQVSRLIDDVNTEEHSIHLRLVWLDPEDERGNRPRIDPVRLDAVLAGGKASFDERDRGGDGYRYTYVPLSLASRRGGALEISQPLSVLESHVHATILRVLALTGGIVGLSGLLVVLLGLFMIGRPLERLISKARAVGAGDLSTPLRLQGHDEFTELAGALNQMSEQIAGSQERIRVETEARIATLEQLRHADRLRTVGRLASGIAHELGTPLNVVSGRADLIASRRLSDDEVVSSAQVIRAQSDRITKTIRQLLDFARRGAPRSAVIDLRDIVRKALDLVTPLARKHGAVVDLVGDDEPAMAVVDAEKIQQVLTNLLINAFQSLSNGGRVDVEIDRERAGQAHDERDGMFHRIDVRDDGKGIPQENLAHLFEPFFTTKDVGEGTGLGLSISYGIVEEHGGWITVESRPGEGSRFSVYLPAGDD